MYGSVSQLGTGNAILILSNGQIEHTSKICRIELEKNGAKAIGSFVCFFHGTGDLACVNGNGEDENMAKERTQLWPLLWWLKLPWSKKQITAAPYKSDTETQGEEHRPCVSGRQKEVERPTQPLLKRNWRTSSCRHRKKVWCVGRTR